MKWICRQIVFKFTLIVFLLYDEGKLRAQELVSLSPQRQEMMPYLVQERPQLAGLLTKAGLSPYLSGEANYTLLAPSEASLSELTTKSPEQLKQILASHLLKGNYLKVDFKDGATLKTLAGTEIVICRKKNQTLVNGTAIVSADQKVKNGVVHTLGGLLKQ